MLTLDHLEIVVTLHEDADQDSETWGEVSAILQLDTDNPTPPLHEVADAIEALMAPWDIPDSFPPASAILSDFPETSPTREHVIVGGSGEGAHHGDRAVEYGVDGFGYRYVTLYNVHYNEDLED